MPFDGTDWETDLRILRQARDGIAQPGGWCQKFHDAGAARCAAGWIPGDEDQWEDRVRRLLVPALPWLYRWSYSGLDPIGAVAEYNDRPWRRQKTMVKMFDRAIRRLERA